MIYLVLIRHPPLARDYSFTLIINLLDQYLQLHAHLHFYQPSESLTKTKQKKFKKKTKAVMITIEQTAP